MSIPSSPAGSAPVRKATARAPISAEALAGLDAMQTALDLFLRWDELPEQEQQRLTAEHDARAAQQRAERAAERAATPVAPLTLATLLDALGLTEAEARHRVQRYCTCTEGTDGFYACPHAQDLGLA